MQLRAAAPDVPIVILSGLQDELLAIKAVQEGAQDYLVKGRVDGAAIGRSITYAAERKSLEMQMAHKAMHDALTELPNRTLFQDRLKHAVMRAKRHQSLLGVMFIDLDGFKPINDSLGHDVGDLLLKALGRRLQEGLRASDTAARFGGDEFMVLCEDVADEQHVISIAERLQGAIAEPFMIAGHELTVSSSMGIVVSSGHDESAESLIRNADARCTARSGRASPTRSSTTGCAAGAGACAHRVRPAPRDRQSASSGSSTSRRSTCAAGRSSGSRRCCAGTTPSAGRGAAEFLWLAEETGLITKIGEWVLRQVWGAHNGSPLRVSVNLSARQHRDPDLVDLVERILTETRTDPGTLCLEITESVGGRRDRAAPPCGAEGPGREAVDRRVRHRPFARIAEAHPARHAEGGPLVRGGVGADAEDAAIVTAIINLAHSLGLGTVADGSRPRSRSTSCGPWLRRRPGLLLRPPAPQRRDRRAPPALSKPALIVAPESDSSPCRHASTWVTSSVRNSCSKVAASYGWSTLHPRPGQRSSTKS